MPAVNKGLGVLESLGVVRELSGRRRNRVYSYVPYVQIIGEGTEPL
jgi:hypothetical protein